MSMPHLWKFLCPVRHFCPKRCSAADSARLPYPTLLASLCTSLAHGFLLLGGVSSQAQRLLWHDVKLDSQGKLLSWVESNAPYDRIIRNAWTAFENIPVQPDGYRTYFTYPTFYGPNDSQHPVFSGRAWCHNPACRFAMLTDAAILYHAYTGDRVVFERVREMLDHVITHGTTEPTDAYPLAPYACSDAGNPVYRGATDTIY